MALSGALHRFGRWYLQFSDDTEDALKRGVFKEGDRYVFVWHPHGAFTIAALYFVSHWWAKDYPSGVPGGQFVCVAPLLLRIPLLAEFLLLCNARSQDARTFNSILSSGATAAVQPGGLVEQVSTDETKETVYFPQRLGFVRLAIKHGVPLLPVYAFGENQLYRTSSWVRQLNMFLYKTFKTGNLVVLGQGGIPNTPILPNPLMLPVFRRGLHVRFGDPVDVGPADENPSDEKVQEVFAKYADALKRVFDAHKDECLPPEVAAKGLDIVVRGFKKEQIKSKM